MIQFIVLVRILYLWGDTVLSRYIKDMYDRCYDAPEERLFPSNPSEPQADIHDGSLPHVELTV